MQAWTVWMRKLQCTFFFLQSSVKLRLFFFLFLRFDVAMSANLGRFQSCSTLTRTFVAGVFLLFTYIKLISWIINTMSHLNGKETMLFGFKVSISNLNSQPPALQWWIYEFCFHFKSLWHWCGCCISSHEISKEERHVIWIKTEIFYAKNDFPIIFLFSLLSHSTLGSKPIQHTFDIIYSLIYSLTTEWRACCWLQNWCQRKSIRFEANRREKRGRRRRGKHYNFLSSVKKARKSLNFHI